jgi:hypothetical protein
VQSYFVPSSLDVAVATKWYKFLEVLLLTANLPTALHCFFSRPVTGRLRLRLAMPRGSTN